jgi:Putative Ig domain
MRRGRRGSHSPLEFGGSGEDSFVAVVVTKLTGALLFILLLAMVIMALLPKAGSSLSHIENVAAADLLITTPAHLPDAVAGRPYTLALASRGGAQPEWSLDGPLPEGLSFDPASALVSGTPKRGTKQPARLIARVRDGDRRDARSLTLAILQPTEPLHFPMQWSKALPSLPWRTWLEQGFGFLILLLVHMVGMNAVGGLERRAMTIDGGDASIGRYRALRWLLRFASLCAAGGLAAWLALLA